ncbi:MAG: hypothetical protein V7K98_21420 [Nostoc sp.]|uniref:hypothetical protein n=1 Tax=Nostoc sp. TaxID=1180 RepID=UPI002FF87D7E
MRINSPFGSLYWVSVRSLYLRYCTKLFWCSHGDPYGGPHLRNAHRSLQLFYTQTKGDKAVSEN